MDIKHLLSPECTFAAVSCESKKRVLELIAYTLAKAHTNLDEEGIFDSLTTRERLGSTGIGHGVAIPHCRLHNCHGVLAVLIQLSNTIDFDTIDGKPVDLVFALVVPEEAVDTHLLALQTIAERFNQNDYRNRLRSATSSDQLYQEAIKLL